MRRQYRGFVLQFTRSDHNGRHIHVFRNNEQIGVYDRVDGPIRGLEREWNRELAMVVEEFLEELNERGY